MLRKFAALTVASALLISSGTASFATDANQSALAPGKPAGVKEAEMDAPVWIWIAGVGLVALGVVLVVSSGHSSSGTGTNAKP